MPFLLHFLYSFFEFRALIEVGQNQLKVCLDDRGSHPDRMIQCIADNGMNCRAGSHAVSHIRKHSRLTLLNDNSSLVADDDFAAIESSMVTDERSRRLHDALPKLKDNYRTALHLIYFEGMSYSEAAQAMGRSPKQIDNYVSRGKAALKKILEEEGFAYEE